MTRTLSEGMSEVITLVNGTKILLRCGFAFNSYAGAWVSWTEVALPAKRPGGLADELKVGIVFFGQTLDETWGYPSSVDSIHQDKRSALGIDFFYCRGVEVTKVSKEIVFNRLREDALAEIAKLNAELERRVSRSSDPIRTAIVNFELDELWAAKPREIMEGSLPVDLVANARVDRLFRALQKAGLKIVKEGNTDE